MLRLKNISIHRTPELPCLSGNARKKHALATVRIKKSPVQICTGPNIILYQRYHLAITRLILNANDTDRLTIPLRCPTINGGIAISQRILGRRLGSYLGHIVSRTALQPVDRSLWGGVYAYSSSSLPLTFSYDRGKSRESQEPLRKVSVFSLFSVLLLFFVLVRFDCKIVRTILAAQAAAPDTADCLPTDSAIRSQSPPRPSVCPA